MSYIGKSPSIGSYSMLDNLTASATASYSLTLDSVAFVPESANHLLVSLNGVIQKAGSSFTVSGSTLTFSSALTSSDSIDFILALGNVLDIGTPSDATVTNAKTNFVSTSSAAGLQIKGDGTTDGTLQLNCSQNSHGIKLKSPAHSASQSYTLTFPTTAPSADKFLKTDGSGNLSFADAGGGGVVQVKTINTTTVSSFGSSGGMHIAVSITPQSSSNKILVMAQATGGSSGTTTGNIQLRRATGSSVATSDTNIGGGAPEGSRSAAIGWMGTPYQNWNGTNLGFHFLDNPATTSQLTYGLMMGPHDGGTYYIGRTGRDTNDANHGRFPTNLTLIEIDSGVL